MSATSLGSTVTDAVTGATQDISAIDIILVTANGSGSKIQYQANGSSPIQLSVTASPATISTSAGYLIPLTLTSSSVVFYVNNDLIVAVVTNSAGGSNVYFDAKLAENQLYVVNETSAEIG